jgi:prephenate dehydrogenase
MIGRDLAVIGAGRFGRFLAVALTRAGYRVAVSDRKRVRIPGVPRITIEKVALRPVIFLALPAGELPGVLRTLAPLVRPGTLVVNLAAVQELPARWMREILPSSVELVGLHMLFGPDSAHSGMRGHQAVLSPVRVSQATLRRVAAFLANLGVRPVTATPRAHDKAMARTLFLTQFTGRALAGVLASGEIRSRNTELLSAVVEASSADAFSVIADLYRYNPYTRGLPDEIIRRSRALLARLKRAG